MELQHSTRAIPPCLFNYLVSQRFSQILERPRVCILVGNPEKHEGPADPGCEYPELETVRPRRQGKVELHVNVLLKYYLCLRVWVEICARYLSGGVFGMVCLTLSYCHSFRLIDI